jgi:Ca-activated chloride channel homolog
MRRALVLTAVLLALSYTSLGSTSKARAWELFRSESSDVRRGNEHLTKGQHKEALEAYDEAARELPDDPGVQLDRGLALLGAGKLGEAREAFRRAAAGNAPKELRAKALYNMGLTFLKDGEQAGQAEDLDGARKLFEESAESFKGSLRAQPGNKDAAWNFEIAKRRLSDVKKKQEEKQQEEKKKQEEQKQQQDKQDQDKQDPQGGGDGGTQQPTPQDGGAEQPDGGNQAQPDPSKADAGAPEPQGNDGGAAPSPSEPQPDPNALPEHMERALDALEAGEENLEKQRARQRARSRPRKVEKDW